MLEPLGKSQGEDDSIAGVSALIPNEQGQREFGPFVPLSTYATPDETIEISQQPCLVTLLDTDVIKARPRTPSIDHDYNLSHIPIRVIGLKIDLPFIVVG